MGRGRSSLALVAAACAVSLTACPPAGAAKRHPTGPGLLVQGISQSQRNILKHGWIGVQLDARNHGSLVRVFASFRPAGRRSFPIVATKLRELKIRRRHWRFVRLRLTSSGRGARASMPPSR